MEILYNWLILLFVTETSTASFVYYIRTRRSHVSANVAVIHMYILNSESEPKYAKWFGYESVSRSRICVKNLPKYVAEDRLRELFSQKGEITDVKLMRTK
jgi:hypothetical protein